MVVADLVVVLARVPGLTLVLGVVQVPGELCQVLGQVPVVALALMGLVFPVTGHLALDFGQLVAALLLLGHDRLVDVLVELDRQVDVRVELDCLGVGDLARPALALDRRSWCRVRGSGWFPDRHPL